MKFDDFLTQAWSDHATNSAEVADRLDNVDSLTESADHISKAAQLIAHVFGEHLGRWKEGIKLLENLRKNRFYEPQGENAQAVLRCIASLELASDVRESVDDFSISDQVRVMALSAAALSSQNNTDNGQKLFRAAVEKAQLGIDKKDPANRALAMTGNSLAAGLEEKPNKSEHEIELMVFAAKTARKYWEIAGTWLEIERAEYRLAMTYLAARELSLALEHAQSCLEIVKENGDEALELFFGYEALASVEKAKNNQIGFSKAMEQMKTSFDKLTPEDKSWCDASMKKLNTSGHQ